MKVVVVGGGVIGLLTAYHCRKLGADVVVAERDRVGQGCSQGNMGWVCPSISTPLPAPGLTLQSLRWLLKVDSPLYIRPSRLPRLLPWLRAFRRHCNADSYRKGLDALGRLTRETPELYRSLRSDGVAFESRQSGLLLVYEDAGKRDAMAAEVERLRSFGVANAELLTPEALAAREPAVRGGRAGALFVRSDEHVRPESLTAGVAHALRAKDGSVVEGFPVRTLRAESGLVVSVEGPRGTLDADAVVLACGAETGRLTSTLGVPLPLQAGKGYSITVEAPSVSVEQPTYFATDKVGLTPFDGALRIAGTMELSGINRELDRRRIRNLERAVHRFIPGALDGASRTDWVGMRPLTPDGLPVIGRLPGWENVFVASGHQMLGVTLAPATGYGLAHQMLAGGSPIDLTPFDPARFR